MDSEKKTAAREFAKNHAEWEDWKNFFESRPADTICNLMIVLIQQCRYMLDRMLKWQEEDFVKNGGVRERMHSARTEARAENWDKAVYSMLALAKTPEELEMRLSAVIDAARREACGIKNRNGWADAALSIA